MCVTASVYLEVYVSDPFHDSVTRPHNGVTVLVLTVCPPNLQSLQEHSENRLGILGEQREV